MLDGEVPLLRIRDVARIEITIQAHAVPIVEGWVDKRRTWEVLRQPALKDKGRSQAALRTGKRGVAVKPVLAAQHAAVPTRVQQLGIKDAIAGPNDGLGTEAVSDPQPRPESFPRSCLWDRPAEAGRAPLGSGESQGAVETASCGIHAIGVKEGKVIVFVYRGWRHVIPHTIVDGQFGGGFPGISPKGVKVLLARIIGCNGCERRTACSDVAQQETGHRAPAVDA